MSLNALLVWSPMLCNCQSQCHYNKMRSTQKLAIHFAYFALLKMFYLIGRRCNCTFCVTTSTMVSTYGTTVKMLQNTVHRGLIVWKVSIDDKDDYKTVTKKHHPHTQSYLSAIIRIHCIYAVMKELLYLCMRLPLKKFL